MGRRAFLRVGLLGVAASWVSLGAGPAWARPRRRRHWVRVFRLSTHGQRTCHACRAHGANRFYLTPQAADEDRAHPGCNCRIVSQPLPPGLAKHYFRSGEEIFDLRWDPRTPQPPFVRKRKTKSRKRRR